MIDEEKPLPVDTAHEQARYGESLLYDFAKFLTTLSLIALGGVLTLSQAADRNDLKPFNIVLAVGAISLAGVTAVSIASAITSARATGRTPSAWLPRYVRAAMALLGIGLGVFLAMWWDALL